MQKPTKEQLAAATDALAPPVDHAPLVVLDRSTLEAFLECPMQGRLLLNGGRFNSPEADSGNEVHAAYSEMIFDYIESGGSMEPADLIDSGLGRLYKSRPDVQPDVIRGGEPALRSFAVMLCKLDPRSVLRFDGGEGRRSGQLAADIEHLGCRVTSELDFLHAGPSAEVLHEIDWKTGQGEWRVRDIADAFQFTTHAWLVFKNYPQVETLEVRVWNTRMNRLTSPVQFDRRYFAEYESRIVMAARSWRDCKAAPVSVVPTFPGKNKCSLCPFVLECIGADQRVKSVNENPQQFVESMALLEAKLDEMKEQADRFVDQSGQDIWARPGLAYGINKPVERRASKSLYEIYFDAENEDSTHG